MFRHSVGLLIKARNRVGKMRWKSAVRDRRISRNPMIYVGENYELHEVKGHELEAFANFAVYKYNKANSPLILHTTELTDLPPKERLEAVLDIIEVRWNTKDSMGQIDRLQMCMQALECFADLCKVQELALSAFSPDYHDRFYELITVVRHIVNIMAPANPDTIGALLHAAEICDALGESDLRQQCFESAEYLLREDDPRLRPSETFKQLFPEAKVSPIVPVRVEEGIKAEESKVSALPQALVPAGVPSALGV